MRSTAHADPPRTQLRLTSEGLAWLGAAVLLGALGWFKSLNLLLLLAYAMLALLALNGILTRVHTRRVRATPLAVPPVHAGEEVRIGVRVENVGNLAATVGVTDLSDGTARQWVLDRLPAHSAVECVERQVFPRRGRFAVAAPVVRSGTPT